MKVLGLLSILLFFTSCMEAASNGRHTASNSNIRGGGQSGGEQSGGEQNGPGGNNAVGNENPMDPSNVQRIDAKVEIRHLIEPKIDDQSPGGAYTRKLTIPKNYNGFLYLAGINVSTLAEKNLKVRFKFGLDASPITIPATIATAAGLTPQTDVEVLVMDMRSQPFGDVRLIYDLFDYNDYDFSDDPAPGTLSEPVQFNRNDKLFCRGLRLQDDPTFTGKLAQGCVEGDDVCKFAYAKIVDKGLVADNWLSPILPTEINVAGSGPNMDGDSNETNLNRCLPDRPLHKQHVIGTTVFPFSAVFDPFQNKWSPAPGSLVELFEGTAIPENSLGRYYYQGPYQATNLAEWQIGHEALLGEYGVFGDFVYRNNESSKKIDPQVLQFGARSKLFPLQTKMQLRKDVQYMGSALPGDYKELLNMGSNTKSQWMDGCNARVSSADDHNGEHIGSCNVTASIEIIAVDDSGKEQIVDASKEVKLQLVKDAILNSDGENVLHSSFNSCSSSSQCGSGSCCINNRCWSKSIVSQCVEDLDTHGHGIPGAVCQSDNECASLCCNQATGRCAVHDTLSDPPVLCSKPSGQACIAKEWCMKHPVTQCYIVNTGLDAQGQKTCAMRCYTYEEFGDCRANAGSVVGICIPPAQPSQPVFNPNDPNRCDEAIDPSEVPLGNI